MTDASSSAQRSVVRAACLNCRSAKRRCDGVQPVCGPCVSRGIEEGGCNFVSSKRGGPRFKGVRGAEAAKVKAERQKQRDEQRMQRDIGKRERDASTTDSHSLSDSSSPELGRIAAPSSSNGYTQQHAVAPQHWTEPAYIPGMHHRTPSQQRNSLGDSAPVAMNGGTYHVPDASTTVAPASEPLYPEQQLHYHLTAQQNQQMLLQQTAPLSPQQLVPAQIAPRASSGASIQTQSPGHSGQVSLDALLGIGFNDITSLANMEIMPWLQEASSRSGQYDADEGAAGIGGAKEFHDFFANLELLPKAGNVGAGGDVPGDPMEVIMDWEGGEVGKNVQDNEQGARTLLTDFYNLVYPACPVLPPPGSLPSLAFYFSGKGPCGLFAALSAVVAMHLSSEEAQRTLKASHHPLQQYEACSKVEGDIAHMVSDVKSADAIAAYHAKTSEFILHQWEEKQRTCFTDLSAANPFDGLDEELITIEAAAAHTLLCHYHYGSNKPLGHQRAYKHAVEAWNLIQRLDIPSRSSWQADVASERTNPVRPFAAELKLEWAKRVYWCSYAAATVMSCTGGFAPFGNSRDGVMDLKVRPSLDNDVSAWGVMVRGAQQVSKCYRLLYDLDQLRTRVAEESSKLPHLDLRQASVERQQIFNAMLKLDAEISTYTRFDAGWRDVANVPLNEPVRTPDASIWPPTPAESDVDGVLTPTQVANVNVADRELARSLKVAGRLMTSGAIILLHRAQAFSNARVFMSPQCGVPQATRADKARRAEPLVHRSGIGKEIDDCDVTSDSMGRMPNSRNGSSLTSYSSDTNSTSNASSNGSFANDHSFLTDRFAGGPFEPAHSLERCRFAASTMVSTLPRVLQDNCRVPKLPPYSACSYVLGAYAILMLTLLIQVRSDMTLQQHQHQQQQQQQRQQHRVSAAPDQLDAAMYAQLQAKAALRGHLETQRAPVRDMITVLSKFSVVWPKAVEYAKEVTTLLQANEILS